MLNAEWFFLPLFHFRSDTTTSRQSRSALISGQTTTYFPVSHRYCETSLQSTKTYLIASNMRTVGDSNMSVNCLQLHRPEWVFRDKLSVQDRYPQNSAISLDPGYSMNCSISKNLESISNYLIKAWNRSSIDHWGRISVRLRSNVGTKSLTRIISRWSSTLYVANQRARLLLKVSYKCKPWGCKSELQVAEQFVKQYYG